MSLRPLALLGALLLAPGCTGGECPPDSARDSTGNCTQVDGGDESGDGGSGDDGGSGSGSGDEGGSGSGDEGDSGSGSGDDTGGGALPLTHGDPITVVAQRSDSGEGHDLVEWMDAEVLSPEHGLVSGQGGWATIDLETGETLFKSGEPRTYRLAVSGDRAVLGRRTGNLVMLDISDPVEPAVLFQERPFEGYHEDVAMDGDVVLVGYLDEGAAILDGSLQTLGVIPVDDAFAVGLRGDRALVTSDSTLSLWDVSDPATPAQLDEIELEGEGRDLAWGEEGHVAVALGGNGVDVFALSGDVLSRSGHLDLAGSAFGVDIDGDYLWIGAWEVVGLAWLGQGGPVIIGHEEPAESAMGIGAGEGLALVPDWKWQSVLKVEEGLAGPELVAPSRVYYPVGTEDPQPLRLSNGGAFDLEVRLGTPSHGWSWDEEPVTLAPGESGQWILTPPSGGSEGHAEIPVSSNDPDEEELPIELMAATNTVGQEHPAFSLERFTWPDTTVDLYSFDPASTEKITFLVYFALY